MSTEINTQTITTKCYLCENDVHMAWVDSKYLILRIAPFISNFLPIVSFESVSGGLSASEFFDEVVVDTDLKMELMLAISNMANMLNPKSYNFYDVLEPSLQKLANYLKRDIKVYLYLGLPNEEYSRSKTKKLGKFIPTN